MEELQIFKAGDGPNCIKLNANFQLMKQLQNANETTLQTIASTALLKDGSNFPNSLKEEIRQNPPVILSGDGDQTLTANAEHFFTPTGNARFVLPNVANDDHSYTCTVVVQGSNYSVDVSAATGGQLISNTQLDITKPYSVMFIYNHIDSKWYYYITQ